MAGSCTEVGLVTYINGCTMHIWLMDACEEKIFTVVDETIILTLGTWLYVNKNDLETLQINRVIPVTEPPVKAWTQAYPPSIEKTVVVEAKVVLPPMNWALKNDYEWFAYSFEFGRVGNFAYNKLLKLNGYKVESDIVYKAVLFRIPPSKIGHCVENIFGTVWTIPPQVLVLCNDQNIFDKKGSSIPPWWPSCSGNRLQAEFACTNNVDEVSVSGAAKDKECSSRLRESVSEVFQSSAFSNDYIPKAAASGITSRLDQDRCGQCYQPFVYLGVVILREPQYSIIWGKAHGFVAVSATVDLVLKQSDWVEYDCIETDTELDVPYLAIYCVLSKRRPLCVEPYGNSIICHTVIHLPYGRKITDVTSNTFTMVCDVLGDVLVPNISVVKRCIRNGKLKAVVLVKYDINEKWPCRLFAVYENSAVQKIDWEKVDAESKPDLITNSSLDLDITVSEDGRSRPLVPDGNIEKVSELQKDCKEGTGLIKNDSPVASETNHSRAADVCILENNGSSTEKIPEGQKSFMEKVTVCEDKPGPSGLSCPTPHPPQKKAIVCKGNMDWLKRKQYIVDSKILTLPVTILVKLTSDYGILWHINRKLILVPAEYLSDSAELGAWMKAKISPLHTTVMDLPYHFIVVRPLEKIGNKLMIRQVRNIVQALVCLEPGAESYVNEGGRLYLQRNSELGHILIPNDRILQNCRTKRFQAWVTFMSVGTIGEPAWVFTRRQRLVEVDKDGNALPDQFDRPIRLAEEASYDGDDFEIGDNSMEESDVGDEEFYDCLPPAS